MTKVIRIKCLLFLMVCALFSLNGCGGGGGSGGATTPTTPTSPTSPVVSNTAVLELGIQTKSGNTVTFPLNFTNPNPAGYSISGIQADIIFDSKAFSFASATAGAAAVLAGKTINPSKIPTGQRIVIIDLGGNKSIGDGVVAQISLDILPGAPAGSTFSLVAYATDPSGLEKTVEVKILK